MTNESIPVRSYARANEELAASFKRYLESKGLSPNTIRSYHAETITYLMEFLGSRSAVDADHITLRQFLGSRHARGLAPHTLYRHLAALRAFYKFLQLTGLVRGNPAYLLAQRKLPTRSPRVLTVDEIERLIAAARTPLERCVIELMYATGARVSELVEIRVENIDFANHVLLIKNGKGNKDRYVLFGAPATKAMWAYIDSRPSRTGFLFEASAWTGRVRLQRHRWYGQFYVKAVHHSFSIGPVSEFVTEASARAELERVASKFPDFRPKPARKYTARAIHLLLKKLAARAGIAGVHPHALRRAMASHLLCGGANIRAVQELLGHQKIVTTQLYTHLTVDHLKAVHSKAHPHAGDEGDDHAKTK
jgi:site-specific recombinase XerD